MRAWQTKDGKKSYKNAFGTTDYDIPMFGYRSAILITFSSLVFIIIGILLGDALNDSTQLVSSIIGGFGFGMSFAVSRFFIETKKGATRGFWITAVLSGIFGILFLFIFYKLKVLL